MIFLDGVQLSSSLQWVNRDGSFRIAQRIRMTTGGGAKVYQQRLHAGIPIVLEANEETGWFTNEMREAMLARADTLGTVFVFEYFGSSYNVVFNHSTPPAVSFEKIIYRQVPDAGDYFMGQLLLVTV